MDDSNKIFGQYQQVPSGMTPTTNTTTILQYMGPPTHQNMAAPWQTQHHIHHRPQLLA